MQKLKCLVAGLLLATAWACGGSDEVEIGSVGTTVEALSAPLDARMSLGGVGLEDCGTCSGYTGCKDQTDKTDCETLGCTWTKCKDPKLVY